MEKENKFLLFGAFAGFLLISGIGEIVFGDLLVKKNLNVTGNTSLYDTLTLYGSAKVYKNEWICPAGFAVPQTKPATKTDWGIASGWEFTDGTDDTIYAEIRLPQDMDRTVAPEFKIGWASADNTGYATWQVEYLYLVPNEDSTAEAQETLTTNSTVSGTANGLSIATITGVDLPSATDQLVLIRIKRLGASDTLGDDCTLLGFGMKYIVDKLGVAT